MQIIFIIETIFQRMFLMELILNIFLDNLYGMTLAGLCLKKTHKMLFVGNCGQNVIIDKLK